MGRLASLKTFIRNTVRGIPQADAEVDMGGGEIATAIHFGGPGDDAQPLPGDTAALLELLQAGRQAAVGYHDTKNAGRAGAGERIVYARDAEGNIVVQLWLKDTGEATLYNDSATVTLAPNGSVSASNSSGDFTLQENGDFVVNGVTIDTNGNILTAGTVEADDVTATGSDVTLGTHNHGGPGPVPGT